MNLFFKWFFLMIMTLSCTSASAPTRSKKSILFRQLSNEFIAWMGKGEEMFLRGSGGGMSGGPNKDKIEEFFFSFGCEKLVDLQQARATALRCAEKFLEMVNSNEEIRPFLEYYPYRPSGLEFVMVFLPYEKEKPDTANKYIHKVFFVRNGLIEYEQYNPKLIDESVLLETYEEALERNKAAP